MPSSPSQPAKSCFVISPIGKEGSSSRKRSDKLLKYVIRPVLELKQYTVDRADQLAEPGMITNQIVKRIIECDILIADLSEGNPNVFYELAIRHGLKKPFIHLIDASESIPFDNAQVRTIVIDLTDLDSVDRAKAELTLQVDAISAGKGNAESPISIAFDLETLKASGNTDEAMLVALFQEVSSIRTDLRDMKRSPTQEMLFNVPRTSQDLTKMLLAAGEHDLARILEEKMTIHGLDPYKLTASTTLHPNEDEELANRFRRFLQAQTRRSWEVEILPF